jgi:hypothetical protein
VAVLELAVEVVRVDIESFPHNLLLLALRLL